MTSVHPRSVPEPILELTHDAALLLPSQSVEGNVELKNLLITGRILASIACISIPTAALAQECSSNVGTLKYCECLYDEALDRIMNSQGTSRASMKQRLEALSSALKKCFDGGTNEAATEMQKI